MKDLHSHYLPCVDDGSKDVDMTKRMLQSAYENGVTDIVFTPHYIENTKYNSKYHDNYESFKYFLKYAKDNYSINLYLGNEVFISSNIYELYKNGEISTINNSRYMLIEIPLDTKINDVKSIFIELINNGIIPILAHPERYAPYYKDIDFFVSLKNLGVLMQMNIPSLTGEYGLRAKKMAKMLLKNDLISFVGTDIHRDSEDKNECLAKALKKLKRMVGESNFKNITELNFEHVVRDENLINNN